MAERTAASTHRTKRKIAWLAVLALLLNVTVPGLAMRAMPSADLFASALCHAGGAPEQPDDQGQGQEAPSRATCPLCLLLTGQVQAVLPTEGVAVPRPMARASASPRGPPAVAALPAQIRPPAARGPPVLT